MAKRSVGDQELALLRYVAEAGPLTVGQAAETFGAEHGWARSTVLTVMERLRSKGYLVRRAVDGVFHYSSTAPRDELLRGVVHQFVNGALDGSVAPFVQYLAHASSVSDEELAELERIVRTLQERRSRP